MPSIDKMLAYAKSRHHKVSYSMAYPDRLGPAALDCSSFVYYSLIAGGFLAVATPIGNTESLFKLKGTVLEEIYSYHNLAPGDIFIRGGEGTSAGARGHTGIFTRPGEIIHCNALNNTVTINNETSFIRYFLDCHRSENERYFRPITDRSKPPAKEQITHTWGRARMLATTNVRTAPTTTAPIVATYKKGESLYYDQIITTKDYQWLSYIGRTSGQRRYVAYSNHKHQWADL